MRRLAGIEIEMEDAGVAGNWLAELVRQPGDRRPAPEPMGGDSYPRGYRSMPFLGFESEEQARAAEQAFLSLSGREATVLAYLAYGHSAKEVAHKLNLSCRTIDTFRTRALLKLRARNTADAVRMLASLSAMAGLTPVREAAE